MSEEHGHTSYMLIFWWLLGLTIAEVAVVYVDMSEFLIVSILLVLAFIKALMVAMYFMHLKYDNIVLSIIAGVPVVLAAIAVAVLAYEYTHDIPVLPDAPPPAAPAEH